MKSTRIIIINLFRIVLGLTFILSGFVKAIDPLGTQYKIEDYLGVLSLGGMLPDFVTLGTSVAISAIEFTLGVLLLFAISRRVISKVTLVFMTIMTLITAWLYIANPISDCGCFGDAIHLTNGETLLKNIIMLVMTAVVVYKPRDMIRTLSNGNSTIVINYSVLFILLYAAYSLYMLPQFDFRPYHIGANIEEGRKIPEGAPQPEFETTFLMKKDGQTKEFTLENYPDSTWEFVDSKTIMVKEGFVPPIHDFSILSLSGDDLTEDILQQKGYTFLLIAPYLEKADDSNFGPIDQIYEYAEEYGYKFYCLTASGKQAIARWQDMTGAEYPFYNTDAVTLKTIIRSNPGMLLLKDGTVIQKWSHNELPNDSELYAPLDQLTIGTQKATSDTRMILKLLMLFILPLIVFSIADRIFAFTKWFKKYKRLTSILY